MARIARSRFDYIPENTPYASSTLIDLCQKARAEGEAHFRKVEEDARQPISIPDAANRHIGETSQEAEND
ncbi:MAG: hypothetical protein K6F50_06810 [Kiritimatiellae bacterium]|nr:hypothetical protein [Kiritimatiellia bacterium]